MQRPIEIQVHHRQRPGAQALGERAHRCQALGEQVAGVDRTVVAVAGAERRRHRQTGTVQGVGELPLEERARVVLAAPRVAVAAISRPMSPPRR